MSFTESRKPVVIESEVQGALWPAVKSLGQVLGTIYRSLILCCAVPQSGASLLELELSEIPAVFSPLVGDDSHHE